MKPAMKVGFTGTRNGMTPEQRITVARLLAELGPTEAHHGDCIGADVDFHRIARSIRKLTVVGHPPSDPKQRAWCICDLLLPEKPYLTRNKNIVDATDFLIATPSEDEEPKPARGQGTWSTVRYGRDKAKRRSRIAIVWPNGAIHWPAD